MNCVLICLVCAAASGPVRLFTPYKRRRRNQPNVEQSPNNLQAKQKKPSEDDSEHDQGIVTKEETTWESITDGIDGTSEYIDSSSQSKYKSNKIYQYCWIFIFI